MEKCDCELDILVMMMILQVFVQAVQRDKQHQELCLQQSIQFHDYCPPDSDRESIQATVSATDTSNSVDKRKTCCL